METLVAWWMMPVVLRVFISLLLFSLLPGVLLQMRGLGEGCVGGWVFLGGLS
jgi:hypothetical protein